jgi:hypothetical protein
MAHARSPTPPLDDTLTVTLRQAARERLRGDFRRAMLLLKRAAFEAQQNAGVWTRYALACMSAGKREEAHQAFKQAVWLSERQGRKRGAEITRHLAELAEAGSLPRNYTRSGKAPAPAFALTFPSAPAKTTTRRIESWHPYHRSRSRKKVPT